MGGSDALSVAVLTSLPIDVDDFRKQKLGLCPLGGAVALHQLLAP